MMEGVVLVRPGEVRTGKEKDVLATLGLGSCVAVALHDPVEKIGALCHAMLPTPIPGRSAEPTGRFASLAVPALVQSVIEAGADRARLEARVVGGATMFGALASDAEAIGTRNVRAARAALEALDVPVLSEDVGGTFGRSVYFNVGDGQIEVRSVHRGMRVL